MPNTLIAPTPIFVQRPETANLPHRAGDGAHAASPTGMPPRPSSAALYIPGGRPEAQGERFDHSHAASPQAPSPTTSRGQPLVSFQPWGQNGASAPTLEHYNDALQTLQDDIKEAMTPLQSQAARVLTVLGTTASVGAAVATGFLSMTALAATATGVGIPVAAAAALAGLGAGLAGMAATVLISAALRALLRRNVKKNPALAGRIRAARSLRDLLQAKTKLTKSEKLLLKNARIVLSEVQGMGASIKTLSKTSIKTTGGIALFLAVLGFAALTSNSHGFYFGPSPLDGIGSADRLFNDGELNSIGSDAKSPDHGHQIYKALIGSTGEASLR